MVFRVKHIGLASAAKFGFVTGAVSFTPVALVIAVLARFLISWLRRTLEGWQHSALDLSPLGKIPVDMVRVLNLDQALVTVQRLDQMPALVVIAAFVIVILIAGVIAAISAGWQAQSYNTLAALSGGLEVELEAEDGRTLSSGRARDRG